MDIGFFPPSYRMTAHANIHMTTVIIMMGDEFWDGHELTFPKCHISSRLSVTLRQYVRSPKKTILEACISQSCMQRGKQSYYWRPDERGSLCNWLTWNVLVAMAFSKCHHLKFRQPTRFETTSVFYVQNVLNIKGLEYNLYSNRTE